MIPSIHGRMEQENGKYFQFPEEVPVNSQFGEECLEAFRERAGLSLRTGGEGAAESGIVIARDPSLGPEAYAMETAEDHIRITASDERGAIWALATLYQLMDSGNKVPCGWISDAPRYRHRGLSLDCVRHFFPIEEVYKIVEEMSLVKMNSLHWVLSNDQGYRIESRVFPELQKKMDGKYYRQDEIKELISFARKRGVEIIPEIDLPGHTTAVLAAYPQLSCFGKKVEVAEEGGIYPVTLCPGKEETYKFLEQLLGEAAELFPGKWFHMGGDEAPDWEWSKCPCCQKKMREENLTETRQLQGYFSNRVRDILAEHGKSVVCWNDSLMASNFSSGENVRGKFTQESCIQYWSVQYAEKSVEYIKQGGSFIYSDMFELYLDYPACMSSLEKIYQCVPEIRGEFYTPDNSNIAGIEGCLWTEHISETKELEERLFPRMYALAENAWSGSRDYGEFCRRLVPYIETVRERGIHCLSIEQADPKGEEKRQGIRAYAAVMQSGMSPEMREYAVKFTRPGEEFEKRFKEKFF